MNLNEIAGIVLTSDGIAHSFGKSDESIGGQNDISHEEYFLKEISSQDWFKNLGINYDPSNLYYQISDMTKYGLSFIINGSSVSHNNQDVYSYCIFVPNNISTETREYFSKYYYELKDLIDRDNAFFQADIFQEGEYVNEVPIDDLDEFYDMLNISKKALKK